MVRENSHRHSTYSKGITNVQLSAAPALFGLFWPHRGLGVHLRARGFPSKLATRLFHFLSALWALGGRLWLLGNWGSDSGLGQTSVCSAASCRDWPLSSQHSGCLTHDEADINSPSEMTILRPREWLLQKLASGFSAAGELQTSNLTFSPEQMIGLIRGFIRGHHGTSASFPAKEGGCLQSFQGG